MMSSSLYTIAIMEEEYSGNTDVTASARVF